MTGEKAPAVLGGRARGDDGLYRTSDGRRKVRDKQKKPFKCVFPSTKIIIAKKGRKFYPSKKGFLSYSDSFAPFSFRPSHPFCLICLPALILGASNCWTNISRFGENEGRGGEGKNEEEILLKKHKRRKDQCWEGKGGGIDSLERKKGKGKGRAQHQKFSCFPSCTYNVLEFLPEFDCL